MSPSTSDGTSTPCLNRWSVERSSSRTPSDDRPNAAHCAAEYEGDPNARAALCRKWSSRNACSRSGRRTGVRPAASLGGRGRHGIPGGAHAPSVVARRSSTARIKQGAETSGTAALYNIRNDSRALLGLRGTQRWTVPAGQGADQHVRLALREGRGVRVPQRPTKGSPASKRRPVSKFSVTQHDVKGPIIKPCDPRLRSRGPGGPPPAGLRGSRR